MPLKLADMLSTSGMQAVPFVPRSAPSELIGKGGPDIDASDPDSGGPARRTRIWEFGASLHCSVIGTCLTTAELRHVLEKLKINGAVAASDHELHSMAVVLAGRREGGARFLQKALDRRHRSVIARYSRIRDAAGLLALWDESLKQGDIPGAYWALLTHPLTTQDIVKRAFGDVHMLSHLVGAANRADIRRLRHLEQDNAALADKVERQQRQLQEGFTQRDQTVHRLNELLAQQSSERSIRCDSLERGEDAGVEALIQDLNRRLARETARRERIDLRANNLFADLRNTERVLTACQKECELLRAELELVEGQLAADFQKANARPGSISQPLRRHAAVRRRQDQSDSPTQERDRAHRRRLPAPRRRNGT
jgi:hypothetical protein